MEEPTPEEGSKAKKKKRGPIRRALGLVGRVVFWGTVIVGSIALVQAWVPMGQRAVGPRLERMMASDQWHDDGFENPEPMQNDWWGMVTGAAAKSEYAVPREAIEVAALDPELYDTAPRDMRITWFGHSTALIEIGGARFLTDPVWGERTSPLSWVGPKRWYPPVIALEDLPDIDAVLISHDHYDHLDYATVSWIAHERDWPFVAPLGVGAHLEYWDVPGERITECDWWDAHEIAGVTVTATPARHASGRGPFDQMGTLWAGYALRADERAVFFSGDTGLFDGLRDIGERLGPFDVTMLEVGAYDQAWPDWHMGPEQAVLAHRWVRGETMIPIHWGLFDLAYHGWTEPIERTLAAAEKAGVVIASPRPGGIVEAGVTPSTQHWWPEVPWHSAEDYPVTANDVHFDPE